MSEFDYQSWFFSVAKDSPSIPNLAAMSAILATKGITIKMPVKDKIILPDGSMIDVLQNSGQGFDMRWQWLPVETSVVLPVPVIAPPPGLTTPAFAPVRAQSGLLEDDVVYRLSLLATNVLQPLKNQFPNIYIVSGLREANSGVGQHEKGEAADIRLTNQTDANLLAMAVYARDHLAFDQLILNFTTDQVPWMHISFSCDSLRYQVLTKDFSDTFHEGLSIVVPYTGEELAAQVREVKALDEQIFAEMTKMQARESRAEVTTQYGDDVTMSSPIGGGGGGGEDPGPDPYGRDFSGVVNCVRTAIWNDIMGLDFAERAFAITQRVAWVLRDQGCGLLIKPGGDNVIQFGRYSLSTQRVCFPDGTIYDIIGGAGDGSCSPQWNYNGTVETGRYVAAIDPGNAFNSDWQSCAIGSSSNAGTSNPSV